MIFIIKKKILKKLKEFKLNYSYVRFYNEEGPVTYIDLAHRTKVRTYLNLFFRMKEVYQEPIVIKFSVLRMIFLAKWFNELDDIYFAKPFAQINKVRTFSHHKRADFIVNFRYKKIYTADDYQKNALPYIMHPINYLKPEIKILPKNIGILLSGNFEEKVYNTKVIADNFELSNRWNIYQQVLKSDKLLSVTGGELMQDLNSGKFKSNLVLMKWESGAIPTEEWRTYLSASEFIFCAPGMTMPMCHNVLEALSVGVIPILNYPHWLNPSLQDDFNCLVYKNNSDIESVIEKALSLSASEKREMVKNVMDYYKKYYENYSFAGNENKELIVLNENISDLI